LKVEVTLLIVVAFSAMATVGKVVVIVVGPAVPYSNLPVATVAEA